MPRDVRTEQLFANELVFSVLNREKLKEGTTTTFGRGAESNREIGFYLGLVGVIEILSFFVFSPTAESYGVFAQKGSGVGAAFREGSKGGFHGWWRYHLGLFFRPIPVVSATNFGSATR